MPVRAIGMPIDRKYRHTDNAGVTYSDLIEHFRTQEAAGEALKAIDGKGVKQPSVAEWKEKGIPLPRQAQYELVTDGKLKAARPATMRAVA
jgi:hypothetical protein